jgi:hypothetical protein
MAEEQEWSFLRKNKYGQNFALLCGNQDLLPSMTIFIDH